MKSALDRAGLPRMTLRETKLAWLADEWRFTLREGLMPLARAPRHLAHALRVQLRTLAQVMSCS
jgi:hypothetical protein